MKRQNIGMRALARSVIARVWRDFRKRNRRLDYADRDYARKEAIARAEAVDFLTQNVGEWKEARDLWATLANVPPERLHERALRQMEDNDDPA